MINIDNTAHKLLTTNTPYELYVVNRGSAL